MLMIGMILLHFKRASISRYISFSHGRIPLNEIKGMIKEMDTIGNINETTHSQWKDLMSEHNSILARGELMMLQQCRVINTRWITFQCLDLFMLQMQSRYLAKLLDDFSSFGQRVLRLVQESPASLIWAISEHIVIERRSWNRLCAQMMTLLHVLGMTDPSSARLRLKPWPDRALLEAAAARVRAVFGRFARADTATPSVWALPARSWRRAIGPAATPSRRATKRRWADTQPPRRAAPAATAGAGGHGAGAGGSDPAQS